MWMTKCLSTSWRGGPEGWQGNRFSTNCDRGFFSRFLKCVHRTIIGLYTVHGLTLLFPEGAAVIQWIYSKISNLFLRSYRITHPGGMAGNVDWVFHSSLHGGGEGDLLMSCLLPNGALSMTR